MNKTMVIDWGQGIVLNHYIPPDILENPNMEKSQVEKIIERLRPEIPEKIEIPPSLQQLYEESNGAYNDGDEEII